MLTLLLFLFPAAGLGDPRWPIREATTRVLSRVWPLSEPSLSLADVSTDPEVRERAIQVRRSADRRHFALRLLLASDAAERRAVALITEPHECDGLPWAPAGVNRFGSIDTRRALCRINRRLGLVAGELACDPDLSLVCETWAGATVGDGELLAGLNDVRFAFRGLSGPTGWVWETLDVPAGAVAGSGVLPGHGYKAVFSRGETNARRKWAAIKAEK